MKIWIFLDLATSVARGGNDQAFEGNPLNEKLPTAKLSQARAALSVCFRGDQRV